MKPPVRPVFAALMLAALSGPNDACGDIRLAPVFSSNMVLQRDVPAKICGTADVGEAVAVKLGHQVVGEAVGAGPEKSWSITLPVLQAGPIPDITVEGTNTIRLTNLLAGDVWVCSGQSNMEMTLQAGPWCKYGGALQADAEVAAAQHPSIRLFTSLAGKPWAACTPETARSFSAVGYFFGRDLQQRLDVPIGLVQAAVGGTPAEYWTPRAAREAWPGFASALASAKATLRQLKPQFDADNLAPAQWLKAAEEARSRGQPAPERPKSNLTPDQQEQVRAAFHVDNVGAGYASRIKPLTTMAIKGVLWYQGEANALRAAAYTELMTQLIGGWRADWQQADLPFVIMQLVNFGGGAGAWPRLRAAQQAVVDTVPRTALAIGIDIGDPGNIHPANKQEAGRRLALAALHGVYALDVIASGPKVASVRFEADRAVLTFDAGGQRQQIVMKPGGESGFELAGADGRFHPAQAQAAGSAITLTSAAVSAPRSIRYAWRDNPRAALFNTAGLPAAPFHTESTEGRTP